MGGVAKDQKFSHDAGECGSIKHVDQGLSNRRWRQNQEGWSKARGGAARKDDPTPTGQDARHVPKVDLTPGRSRRSLLIRSLWWIAIRSDWTSQVAVRT